MEVDLDNQADDDGQDDPRAPRPRCEPTYFAMERASAAKFTQPLTRTDALYFSVTVFRTVG